MAKGGASRDVEIDVAVRDKTGPGIQSVNRNLKTTSRSAKESQGALSRVASDWSKGVGKITTAAKRWADSGDTSGKRFAKGALAGLSALGKAGGAIGGALSSAVSSAGPHVQVAVAGVLVGGALAAAPAMGAAIVGGAAGIGIVGGVLLARRDARVAAAFESLGDEAGTQLTEAAKRFVPATLGAVQEARAGIRGMLPDLRRLFDVSATWVLPITRSLLEAGRAALSGITAAVVKAGPIIQVVTDSVRKIGLVVGEGFKMLSDNGASMALGLQFAMDLVVGSIRAVFLTVNALVEVFEWAASKIPGLSGRLEELKTSQVGAQSGALNLAGGLRTLAGGADSAAGGLTRAKQAADQLVDGNISLARAQISSREATSQATQAIKANAEAKMTNKQRADANRSSLLGMADAFNAETAAGEASKISSGKASDAYHNNRNALIRAAEAAGHTRTEAERLAAQWLKTPKNVTTTVNANTANARAEVESFQKKVTNLKGKTVNVTVRVTSSGDHYIPGVGTQVKGYAAAWGWSPTTGDQAGVRRAGGPTQVEVTSKLAVSLDGKPFRDYTTRSIANAERRTSWRDRVGKR